MADGYTLADFLQGRGPNQLMDQDRSMWWATPPNALAPYAYGKGSVQPIVPQSSNWPRLANAMLGSAVRGDFMDPRRADPSWVPQPVSDYVDRSVGNVRNDLGRLASHPEDIIGPGNLTGIFAGRLARTANLPLLRRAEEMAAAGRPREQIWNETGWFRGRDGQWRFEIDDSGARLTNDATASAEYTGPRFRERPNDPELPPGVTFNAGISTPSYEGSLGSGLHHPGLYEAYPSLAQAEFGLNAHPQANGSYVIGSRPGQFHAQGPDDPTRRGITLHEIQHGIQEREGFAQTRPGGPESDRMFRELQAAYRLQDEAERPQSLWQRLFGPKPPEAPSEQTTFNMLQDANRMFVAEYPRQAAEAEANNVIARMDMTPEQRLANPPWTTYPVPEEQQFIPLGREPFRRRDR